LISPFLLFSFERFVFAHARTIVKSITANIGIPIIYQYADLETDGRMLAITEAVKPAKKFDL
jgi:hypothetical protein